jgi:hypothetical protein
MSVTETVNNKKSLFWRFFPLFLADKKIKTKIMRMREKKMMSSLRMYSLINLLLPTGAGTFTPASYRFAFCVKKSK